MQEMHVTEAVLSKNLVQKVLVSVFGAFSVIGVTASDAIAQSCAGLTQLQVNKDELVRIGRSQGIQLEGDIEGAFERFAVDTIIPNQPITPYNGPDFPVSLPRRRFVRPDGVVPLEVRNFPFPSVFLEDSVFFEVKAVRFTNLSLTYNRGQIDGFIQVLASSDAAEAERAVPALILLTTSDVVPLDFDTIAEGFFRGVAIFHSIVCKPLFSVGSVNIQLGPARLMNPGVYDGSGVTPLPVGPGREEQLGDYRF
jgi:hypothetical protein